MTEFLSDTWFFDFKASELQAFSDKFVKPDMAPIEKAVALYYAVRDEIAYNPYTFSSDRETFTASHCVQQSHSYCVPKAILLVALARLNGIPARLGLADVKNHLSSQALLDWLKTDEFVMHGYAELYVNNNWVKATPAFDARLCKHMGVKPLEFNGKDDSVFHEFNGEGDRAMEYLRDHGQYADVPFDKIILTVMQTYPHLVKQHLETKGRSLEQDLES